MKNGIMIKYVVVFVLVIAIGVLSCQSDKSNEQIESDIDSILQITKKEKIILPDEKMDDIIKSIPSPIEMTALIKATGEKYSEDILNSTDNLSKYSTNFDKAIHLGMYGADLGYINLYEKTYASISYLDAVKQLADELMIGHFFDFAAIKRLAENNQNLDSILYISTSGFEKMNDYLKEKQRGNISILILIGGWFEALHISTKVVKNSRIPNKELIDRIGEQKIVLNDLLLLLSSYNNTPKYSGLTDKMLELKNAYEKVTITYEYKEPEMKEDENGNLIIVDNSTSTININKEQLLDITNSVNNIRKYLIK